ncbi:hypothetical protein B0T16DRAFT_455800 [Cercophora newfieldiana]|uniref:Zn(2)-C6 fungal-type domain-containing protein n=1 Tax=Cercophora newfieldiana TaxID=92897 RepID=A0AA39Y9A7_9PEZI|nr:hypothetical protein B0T16DRAFT_455800 [Cercophora newfieldiana]
MDDNSAEKSGSGTKTRRTHRKSRFGCTKCKERRIKCDELAPRCSRCNKMNLICEYPRGRPDLLGPGDFGMEPIDPLLLHLDVPRMDWGGSSGSPESSGPGHSPAAAGSPSSSASSAPSPLFGLSTTTTTTWNERSYDAGLLLRSPLRSQVAQTLAPAEFELLKHYLEHTSRDPSVDEDDKYVLQVGIPNLACQSKALMKSILALSAVCRCCDIIKQSTLICEDRSRVMELLTLANDLHQEALLEIQPALHESRHLDHVLANAAMMGMYGSASHRARIWLAQTATFADPPLPQFTPKHSQWFSLFRTARLAYAGLVDIAANPDATAQISPSRSPASSGSIPLYEYRVSTRQEQPTPVTSHPLSPILAATIGSALTKLRQKAAEIAIVHASDTSPELQSCFTALTTLSTVITDTFSIDARPITPGHSHSHSHSQTHLAFEVAPDITAGRLSELSPWLRKYAASITSAIPSKVPRRVIHSFIHKVPTAYLTLIEEIAELLQGISLPAVDPQLDMSMGWDPAPAILTPSIAHQLALDIFAHWLVLILLLDDVWWIGGIGSWELGRIVATRKDLRWGGCLWNRDEDWWPESMYEVGRQFEKHRGEGGAGF